jgi:hypothetical protein
LTQDTATIVRRFIEETINQGQINSAAQFVWEDRVVYESEGAQLDAASN